MIKAQKRCTILTYSNWLVDLNLHPDQREVESASENEPIDLVLRYNKAIYVVFTAGRPRLRRIVRKITWLYYFLWHSTYPRPRQHFWRSQHEWHVTLMFYPRPTSSAYTMYWSDRSHQQTAFIYVQGDPSGSSKPPVDIKTKVVL